MRLTAQFVAKNGRSFLNQLMQREAKNFQFDFLRPQHSLFQYFTKLVDQYTKVCDGKKILYRLFFDFLMSKSTRFEPFFTAAIFFIIF